jgi:hypothetical protein
MAPGSRTCQRSIAEVSARNENIETFSPLFDGFNHATMSASMAKASPPRNSRTLMEKLANSKPSKVGKRTLVPLPGKQGKPVLLSGGNPQIAKGHGEAPVQAYIAAMPGWKSDVGRRLDNIIGGTVPGVCKAVKWNSPLYGVEQGRWFLGIHVFAKYVKVAFFNGASLTPLPPVASKQKEVRYFHVHEDDELDENQFSDWVMQASELPGERM